VQPQHVSQLSHGQLSPRRHPSLLVMIEEGWLPESLTRRTRLGGDLCTPRPGVAGITSEWWPASARNGGRLQIGIPAGINSEYLAGMRRNLH
jgi:hypothetical protein